MKKRIAKKIFFHQDNSKFNQYNRFKYLVAMNRWIKYLRNADSGIWMAI